MEKFELGTLIGVKCEVQPGPFSDELLISVETMEGPISGFVRRSELREEKNGNWSVRGTILSVESDSIKVRIRGSFFTTNGLASVPRHLAIAA